LKYFRRVSQREDVVFEVVGREILDAVGQPGLVVHEEDGDVVFVETVVFEGTHRWFGSWFA
jgi:hypothetical protein